MILYGDACDGGNLFAFRNQVHVGRGLHVDPYVAGVHRQRERFGRWQPVAEASIGQQRPHVTEGDVTGEVLDVHAPVAQRAAVPVGLSDLGLEGDHAFQTRMEAAVRSPVQHRHAVLLAR